MLENKLGLVNQITKLLAKERSLPALYAIIHFYPYGTESLQIFDTRRGYEVFLLRYLFIHYDNILRMSCFREIDQTAASRECIENAG